MAENKAAGYKNDYIIQVNHLTKLYGAANRTEASRMMKEGRSKEEVLRETGVTVALWDVSFIPCAARIPAFLAAETPLFS